MNTVAKSTLTLKQREERTAGLGGSDALAYCGKDPSKTPLELYLEKTGGVPERRLVRDTRNARMDWGSRLEPVVRDWLAERLGRRIHISKRLYRSTELPMLIGHIDGVTASPMEGVELKTADKFMASEFGDVGTDAVPVRYVLQCMHYMIVTRFRRFHLGALVGGNDARHYVIDWDQDLADMLIERAQAFWKHVETKSPPDPVTLEDADRRWPQSLGRSVVASDEMIEKLNQLQKWRAAERTACMQADEHEVALKNYMGDASGLINARHQLIATWRSQSQERFDVKGFTAAYPELSAQYRKTSEYRVFRLK